MTVPLPFPPCSSFPVPGSECVCIQSAFSAPAAPSLYFLPHGGPKKGWRVREREQGASPGIAGSSAKGIKSLSISGIPGRRGARFAGS